MGLLDLFVSVINQTLPEPHAGLLAGILFGVKASLSSDLKNSLITTGTLHIVALSGMNISILTTIVQSTLLKVIKRPIANLISISIIIGFIFVVGPSASVIRAAIMGSLSLLAVTLGKRQWPLYGLILAVSCMLLLNPLWIADLSFQLSVLATLGIILFAKKNSETAALRSDIRRESFPDRLLCAVYSLVEDDLRVTLAAQVFTIPLIAVQFQRISLISPLTNVLIGWIIPPLTAIGLGMVAIGIVFLPLAQAIAWGVWVMLQYMLMVIELTSHVPIASIGW